MKEAVVRFQDILEAVGEYAQEADIPLLRKAYIFAAVAHRGQLRKSGVPYLSHPLAVTRILTDTIFAGLKTDLDSGLEIEAAAFARCKETVDYDIGMTNFIQNGPRVPAVFMNE